MNTYDTLVAAKIIIYDEKNYFKFVQTSGVIRLTPPEAVDGNGRDSVYDSPDAVRFSAQAAIFRAIHNNWSEIVKVGDLESCQKALSIIYRCSLDRFDCWESNLDHSQALQVFDDAIALAANELETDLSSHPIAELDENK